MPTAITITYSCHMIWLLCSLGRPLQTLVFLHVPVERTSWSNPQGGVDHCCIAVSVASLHAVSSTILCCCIIGVVMNHVLPICNASQVAPHPRAPRVGAKLQCSVSRTASGIIPYHVSGHIKAVFGCTAALSIVFPWSRRVH